MEFEDDRARRGGKRLSPEQAIIAARSFEQGPIGSVLAADGATVATSEAWRLAAQLHEASGTPAMAVAFLADQRTRAANGEERAQTLVAAIDEVVHGERQQHAHVYRCSLELEDRWFELRATSIPEADGGGAVLVHVDVTPSLLRRSLVPAGWERDDATGLLNARGVAARTRELREVERSGLATSGELRIALTDLPALERLYGAAVVRHLLAIVVNRVLRIAGPTTEIGRLADAELVVLLAGIEPAAVAAHAEAIEASIAAPIQLDRLLVEVGVHVEVTRGGPGDEPGERPTAQAHPSDPPPIALDALIDPDRLLETVPPDAILNAVEDGLVVFDETGAFRFATRLAAGALEGFDVASMGPAAGWTAHDALGRPITTTRRPSLRALAAGHPMRDMVVSLTSPEGDRRWFEVNSHPYAEQPDGPVAGVVCAVRDVTTARQTADQLQLQAELLDTVGQAVIAWSTEGEVLYLNRAAKELYGWPGRSAIGKGILDVTPALDDAALQEAALAVFEHRPWTGELVIARADGPPVPVAATNTPVIHHGRLIGHVGVSKDISVRRANEERMRQLLTHDTLTGLPNRRGFAEQLATCLAGCDPDTSTPATTPAVLLIDLGQLERIADAFGHDVGEDALRACADVVRSEAHEGDVVGRISDRVLALCSCRTDVDPRTLGERLRRRFDDALLAGDTEVRVRASVGIASLEPHLDASEVIRRADTARLVARRDRTTVAYDDAMRAALRRQVHLEQLLERALRAKEVTVGYQPLVRLSDGGTVGAEALLRMVDDDGTPVPAADLVEVAERSGRIGELGELVLRTACRDAKRWRDLAPELDLHVSVNVSAHQLGDDRLVDQVRDACQAADLPPRALWLEVTESALMTDPARSALVLGWLKALGVTLAADDFGTGYSSLGQLRAYPLDVLKLDRSFVVDLPADLSDLAITRAVVGMADALELRVVAEGIELDGQLQVLAELGVELGQGFRWSEALDPATFERWLTDEGERAAAHLDGETAWPQPAEDRSSQLEVVRLLAHELRGPLTAITGYASLLGEEPIEGLDIPDQIRRAADRMERVLRGLTEREHDREARDPVPVDVLGLITSVVAGLAHSSARIDLAIAELGDPLVRIAEPTEVEQVLHNLVENAVKHAAPGTAVEVAVSRLEPWIEVAISNDGQPIAAEDVPKIFRKYGRATDQRRGSGIGLYMARRLARANGGDVRHRVRPGGGATFVLRLPLARLERTS